MNDEFNFPVQWTCAPQFQLQRNANMHSVLTYIHIAAYLNCHFLLAFQNALPITIKWHSEEAFSLQYAQIKLLVLMEHFTNKFT